MAGRANGGRRRAAGPAVGSIVTATVVGQAKRGVQVEVGSVEMLLPRRRYGAAADRIEASGYGDALTVEVVAEPAGPGGTGLSRLGIERSVRQPRPIEGSLGRVGGGVILTPTDGSAGFAVVVLDRVEVGDLVGSVATWSVGAPYADRRFVVVADG